MKQKNTALTDLADEEKTQHERTEEKVMDKVHEADDSSAEKVDGGNSTSDDNVTDCDSDGNGTNNETGDGNSTGTNGTKKGNGTKCDDGSHGVKGSDTWYIWRYSGDDYYSWHWRTYHREPRKSVDEVAGFNETKGIRSHPAYKKMMK